MAQPDNVTPIRPLPASAEDWLARLHAPDCSSEDEEAFERWRASDPDHAAAYAEVEYLHQHAARLAEDPLLRAVARAARRDLAARRAARPQRTWLLVAGMAACLLAALGLVWFAGGSGVTEQHYASTTGLPQTITLSDGTQVRLDAESSLATRYSAHQREVTVLRGRAQFDVAHQADRPFVVHVDGNEIHDIGTVFQVSQGREGVTVALLSGSVSVTGSNEGTRWVSHLEPAQQMHIDPAGRAGRASPLDLLQAEGWTHGELTFRDQRLDTLVASMNRYSPTRVRIGDPALAALKVSGSFHAGDQQALVTALARGWQLQARSTGKDELTLFTDAGQR